MKMRMGNDKTQIGPRVEKILSEAYDWLVRDRNDGKYKGRMPKEAEKGYKAQIGLHAATHPEALEELRAERPELADYIENECIPMHRQTVENSPFAVTEREAFETVEKNINDSRGEMTESLGNVAERLKRLEDVMFDMYHEKQTEKREEDTREN